MDPRLLAELERHGREALGEAALDRWLLPVVAAFGLLYTARLDGEIVGSAQIIRCLEEDELYMDGFYIREPFRRQGHGAALLAAIKHMLAGEGVKRLLVTVDPGNETAIGLYRAAGFSEYDYLPDFYGRGQGRFLFALDLRPAGS